jgi:hypothetical protein
MVLKFRKHHDLGILGKTDRRCSLAGKKGERFMAELTQAK